MTGQSLIGKMIDRPAKFWGAESPLSTGLIEERPVARTGNFEWYLRRLRGTVGARLPFERWRGIRFAQAVDARWQTVAMMTDDDLTAAINSVRPRLLREGFGGKAVVDAFALIAETADRTLGMAPYPVQIRGGYGMLRGGLIEMATGEGKTLTALLPAAAAALAGVRVHVVTVNDYLAVRDMEELAPAYRRLGLDVGVITHDTDPDERRTLYRKDIVYINNKEVVFDYLRDRAAALAAVDEKRQSRSRMAVDRFIGSSGRFGAGGAAPVSAGLNFAIVDEADSILIDEALTPLILASKTGGSDGPVFAAALRVAGQLVKGRDFTLLAKEKHVRLTDAGETLFDQLAATELEQGVGGLWSKRQGRLGLVRSALAALHLYHRDRDYVIMDGSIQIVDDATGRILPDRTWQAGLHQLIEAKEQVELTEDQTTIARITYQRFFARYRRACGMSGTVMEVAGEVSADYRLPIMRVPTHRPIRRKQLAPQLFLTRDMQYQKIVQTVLDRAVQHRQPVLIGVRSVETSEQISAAFTAAGIEHAVLNAVQDKEEAQIIARAGTAGTVTIATNMAGRGTDIKPDDDALNAGGLFVILTELHDSPRIDRQLFGRAGRQGQVGGAQIIMSLDDPLLMTYVPRLASWVKTRMANRQKPVPVVMTRVLRFTVQLLSERHRAAIRRDTRQQDDRLLKSLSLAGRGE